MPDVLNYLVFLNCYVESRTFTKRAYNHFDWSVGIDILSCGLIFAPLNRGSFANEVGEAVREEEDLFWLIDF